MNSKKEKKRQITITLDDDIIKEMEKIRDETGLAISQQIQLKMKQYKIINKEGNILK